MNPSAWLSPTSLLCLAVALTDCGRLHADPAQPGPDTTVLVEVTCLDVGGRLVIEADRWRAPLEAEVAPGATASTVVGFWGRARPIRISLEGRTLWTGPVTRSLGGPNHLRLVVRAGAVDVIAEVDPSLDGSPFHEDRQTGHVPFATRDIVARE